MAQGSCHTPSHVLPPTRDSRSQIGEYLRRALLFRRAVLNGKKKVFQKQFSQKSPRALHVLNHGWWRLAVGSWRRLAVGSWQLAVGGGWWWLAAVGGW